MPMISKTKTMLQIVIFLTCVKGFSAKSKHMINCLNLDSAFQPMPIDESLLIPTRHVMVKMITTNKVIAIKIMIAPSAS